LRSSAYALVQEQHEEACQDRRGGLSIKNPRPFFTTARHNDSAVEKGMRLTIALSASSPSSTTLSTQKLMSFFYLSKTQK
jgi:hypothetical protein